MASNFNSFNSIYVMNKIFKCILGVLGIFFIGINLCNADSFAISWLSNISSSYSISTNNYNSSTVRTIPSNILTWNYYICVNEQYYQWWSFNDNIYLMECTSTKTATVNLLNDSTCNNIMTLTKASSTNNALSSDMKCFKPTAWNSLYFTRSTTWVNASSMNIWLTFINTDILQEKYWNSQNCPNCPACEEQYTSLECQTEYNLIPISSVTQSYCELNFNLIDPSSCPISEWSWVVNWSSLFINNTQYAWNENIEIFIPDFIWWSIIYNSWSNYIDIEWYNADTEYIEDVIDKTKVTPTADDFALLMQGTANFIPYLFIWLIILFMVKIFSKIWK